MSLTNDSAAVDAAVQTRMLTDPTLAGLLPDGIFFERAPVGVKAYGIVSMLAHEDIDEFDNADGGTAFEKFTYLLKAVALDTTAATVDAAAAQIKALFHLSDPTTFTPAPIGYGVMHCTRVARFREREVDAQTDETWEHAGGHYEIWVQAI